MPTRQQKLRMATTVIKAENISKQYRLGTIGTGNLYSDITRWWHSIRGKEDPFLIYGETNDQAVKGTSDYVWALRDISFEVEQGDLVGLIGKNGSGKSTLLKLLAKITAPTTGEARLKGRVASMLEVGTGFHPELTGRENVFLNGTIMGMTKKEVSKKFDEIVEFAGVARYIDTPIKRYSSGMSVRLAFSVAAHLDPEILLVDEVLAVGDAEFQQKCLGKMSGISQEGRTIIFVSHNLGSVRKLCNKGLVLSKGHLVFDGEVSPALDAYLDSLPTHDSQGNNSISFNKDESKLFQFTEISIEDGQGQSRGKLYYGEDIVVALKYTINDDCRHFSTRLSVARNGETLFWSFDTDENEALYSRRAKGEYSAKIALPRFFKAGIYTLSISFIELGIEKEEHVDVIRFVLDDSKLDTTIKSWHAGRPGILKPRLNWVYTEHPVEV